MEVVPKLFGALVPFFRSALGYPIRSREVKEALEALRATHDYWGGATYLNFDAVGAFLQKHSDPYPLMRLNRDGTVERTDFVRADGPPGGPIYLSGQSLRDRLLLMLDTLRTLRRTAGIVGPALVSVTLLGMQGMRLRHYTDEAVGEPFSDDQLTADLEVVDEASFGEIRRDVADYFWQAAGHRECTGFDESGNPVA